MDKLRLACAVFLAVAASARLEAATTVPNTFSAGQAASASAVNQNFSTVAGAVDAVDTRVQALERDRFSGNLAPETITTVANPMPVGTTVTASGQPFTIKRLKLPTFGNNGTVLMDMPFSSGTSIHTSNSGSYYSVMSGGYVDLSFVTTAGGHAVRCRELNSYSVSEFGSGGLSHTFHNDMQCALQLDAVTWVGFEYSLSTCCANNAATSNDYSSIDPYGDASNAASRSAIKSSLRGLLQYISIN